MPLAGAASRSVGQELTSQQNIIMSYAAAAAKGPKQSPEEVSLLNFTIPVYLRGA